MTDPPPGERVPRGRGWWLVGFVAFAVLGALAGWIAIRQVETPTEAAAKAAPPEASPITAGVEQRVLTSEIVLRGSAEVSDEALIEVPPPVDATPIVTAIPVDVGATLQSGSMMLEVAERPVFIFEGELPMFRTITTGSRGDDVLQLEQNLDALELLAGSADEVFDSNTSRALRRLYTAEGFPPAEVGGAVAAVRSEIIFLSDLPRQVEEVLVERGGSTTGGPVLRVSTEGFEVRTAIAATDRSLITEGDVVEIAVDERGVIIEGRIDFISSGLGGSNSFEVIVRPTVVDDDLGGILGTSVRVIVPIDSTGSESLVVPVSALTASAQGGALVQVQQPDGSFASVEVTPGLTAGGLVAVSATAEDALAAGDRVLVSEPSESSSPGG